MLRSGNVVDPSTGPLACQGERASCCMAFDDGVHELLQRGEDPDEGQDTHSDAAHAVSRPPE